MIAEMTRNSVQAWQESIQIPTYLVGESDPNPLFLENRVYQGSSGAVYPYPVIDRISDERCEKSYQAFFLENQYLKIMILPELGGRVQMALDKTNGYHFVYYNQVVKPALVGLVGPWISGGIEFNWPQHHRPNTFGPVDCQVEENEDGSRTVWCSEIDRMERTKGMHGLTLYPDKAYLEVEVKLYNRTDLPQTFLWWANPAIHVDENHQSIFPPDVTAVMDHGKRDVSDFPIATGEYYKVDYSPGTDISRYANIPVPTSYMAHRSNYDFVGSYDHGKQAGLLHVANHHISPGKKQWTWGNGDFGYAWDRHLTDEDGPYIELMCGVYTDNQPDFSWLMPGEQKSFSQFFMPYKGIGVVKNATVDAAVGLELTDREAIVRAYTTSEQPGASCQLTLDGEVLLRQTFDGSPSSHFETRVHVGDSSVAEDLQVSIFDRHDNVLVAYESDSSLPEEMPEPAKAISPPAELDSAESLFLAGLHLEQYRHATRRPEDYYREALIRDSGDVRSNTALGRLLYRRGEFQEAEEHFRRAILRLTRHNPNPYDGEPHYCLGLCLEAQEDYQGAYDALHKSIWNASSQGAGYFALARLACRAKEYGAALTLVEKAISRNSENHRALHLKICLLRLLGDSKEALHLSASVLEQDQFNVGARFEEILLNHANLAEFDSCMRKCAHSYLELAIEYASFGLYREGIRVLESLLRRTEDRPGTPMVYYFLADYHHRVGNDTESSMYLQLGASHSPSFCFPNRLEELVVLRRIVKASPSDARAHYYLGNILFAKQQYNTAIQHWEKSSDLDPSYSTVWRNLGLAYFNKCQNGDQAWSAYERAFRLDSSDARVLYELDQLAKRLSHPSSQRLERLEAWPELVSERDDLYLEQVTLLNEQGSHKKALELILARTFHPWEGGEGKVPTQFMLSIVQLARDEISHQRYEQAIELLLQTKKWPESLGEGKLAGIQENNIHYWLGLAHHGVGDTETARGYFERAAVGLSEPSSAVYYNDQPPEMIFYQGLALEQLGRKKEALMRFDRLLEYGRRHINDEPEVDFFAVSLPEFLVFEADLPRNNRTHCHFMMALGHMGRGEIEEARQHLRDALVLTPHHQGAILAESSLSSEANRHRVLEQVKS